jgi:ABC-2 type transport system ATP-binding protein
MVNSVVSVRIGHLHVVRGDNEVIPDLSAEIRSGEITGLLGPSGCGKTTLMRSIVGVQKVAGGTVEVLGMPAGSAELRWRLGYVTQAPSVYGDLTVEENLSFFGSVLSADAAAQAQALATVGLDSAGDRVVNRLSGGQRSRVSLAVALLSDPDVLVLDEPTVGLDPVLRKQLWTTFAELAAAGATIIVSSHVMDEAERCDRLLLMRDGALIADDTPSDLLATTHTGDIESAFLALVETGAPA